MVSKNGVGRYILAQRVSAGHRLAAADIYRFRRTARSCGIEFDGTVGRPASAAGPGIIVGVALGCKHNIRLALDIRPQGAHRPAVVSGRCVSAADILAHIVVRILRGGAARAQRVDECAQIVGVGRVALLGQSVGDLGLVGLSCQRITGRFCIGRGTLSGQG